MTLLHRRAWVTRVAVTSIFVLGFVLTGTVLARQGGSLVPSACPPPGSPSSFWGYITLNGVPAPVGMKLAARVNGVEVATTTTQAAGGAAYYLIDVPARAYDTVTGEVCRQGGATGETVSFVLCNYVNANETGTWNGGSQVQRNLTASGACAAPSSTPTNTPTHTPTATSTATRTATSTSTATPTNRPTATATSTSSRTPTATPTSTPKGTSTSTATATKTGTATNTPTASKTPTPTSTSTPSPTSTMTFTATPSPTQTSSPTVTDTPTATATWTVTASPTLAPEDIALSGLVYDGLAGRSAGIASAQVFALMCDLRSFGTTTGSDGKYSLIVRQASSCDLIHVAAWANGYSPAIWTFAVADLREQPVADLGLLPLPTPTPTVTPTRPTQWIWLPLILN